MSTRTYVYSADDVVCSFGALMLERLGEGDDVISIEPEGMVAETRVGANGSAVVSVHKNFSAQVTVRLLRGAIENDIMQQELNLFRATGVTRPFLLKDTRGREIHVCDAAYIAAQPSSTHGTNASDIEWTIYCPLLRSYQGGLS